MTENGQICPAFFFPSLLCWLWEPPFPAKGKNTHVKLPILSPPFFFIYSLLSSPFGFLFFPSTGGGRLWGQGVSVSGWRKVSNGWILWAPPYGGCRWRLLGLRALPEGEGGQEASCRRWRRVVPRRCRVGAGGSLVRTALLLLAATNGWEKCSGRLLWGGAEAGLCLCCQRGKVLCWKGTAGTMMRGNGGKSWAGWRGKDEVAEKGRLVCSPKSQALSWREEEKNLIKRGGGGSGWERR